MRISDWSSDVCSSDLYERVDGSVVKGPSLSDLVAVDDAAVDTEMEASLEGAFTAMQAMVDRANTIEAYDQMIGEGNAEGNAVVEAVVKSLTDQTRHIERVVRKTKEKPRVGNRGV